MSRPYYCIMPCLAGPVDKRFLFAVDEADYIFFVAPSVR